MPDPRLERLKARRATEAAAAAQTPAPEQAPAPAAPAKYEPGDSGIPGLPEFLKPRHAKPAEPEHAKSWSERLGLHQASTPEEAARVPQEDQDSFNKRFENLSTLPGAAKQIGSDVASWWANMLDGPEAAVAAKGAPAAVRAALAGKNALASGAHGAVTAATNALSDNAEHPEQAAGFGGIASAALGPTARFAGNVGDSMKKGADRLMTHVFMTPPQRASYATRFGTDGLSKLGADARAVGLFKPESPLGYLRPASASRVASNAERLDDSLGRAVGAFEDDLTARGVNPDTDITPIVKQLRDAADKMELNPGTGANADAAFLREQADDIERKATRGVNAKEVAPPQPRRTEAVQQELAGVDTSTKPQQKPFGSLDHAEQTPLSFSSEKPPAQTRMQLPEPEAKPEAWKPGDMRNAEQAKLPLERSGQMPLKLDESGQAGFGFENPSSKRQAVSGGDPQAPLFPGNEPAADVSVTQAGAEPSQQAALDLATQRDLGLPPRAIETPWTPGDLRGEQQMLSGVDKPIRDQLRVPATTVDEQQALPLPPFVPKQKAPPIPPVEGEASGELTMPFSQVLAGSRDMGGRINWNKNPNAPQVSYGQDMAQKFIYGGEKDAARAALDKEVAAGNVSQEGLDQYRKNISDLHTVKTAQEPALKLAEKKDQVGLSLGEMLLGNAAGGPMGPAIMAASKANRGTWAAGTAGFTRNASRGFHAVSDAAGAASQDIGKALGNAGKSFYDYFNGETPKESVSDRNARMNESLKKRLSAE